MTWQLLLAAITLLVGVFLAGIAVGSALAGRERRHPLPPLEGPPTLADQIKPTLRMYRRVP